ncbi:MAG: metallophosphoesterase [Tannerellaceae bacterium]|nr:metallophosphoesterase [Tannerellaceae bacterium]
MKGICIKVSVGVLCFLAVAVNFSGCEKNGSNEAESFFFYIINNREATRRLSSIMYHRGDTSHSVERFKLVHISDPHLSGWSGDNHYTYPENLIESVTFANQHRLRINAMVETGDHISQSSVKDARQWMISFFHYLYHDNRIPTFSCYGNHDSNIEKKEDYLPASELAAHVHFYRNHPIQKPFSDRSYYYADVPDPQGGMIRFIALDMLDQPGSEYNTLHYAVFSQEQINWLARVALREEMTERHSVILLTHFPVQMSAWGGKAPGGGQPLVPSYLFNGNFLYPWEMIPDIVEAFRTRSFLKGTYPNGFYPERPGVLADFDFTDATGEFVCYLGGHAHCFALFDVQNTGASLAPQKMILCTNQAPSESSSPLNKVVRREKTISSNSFNIYAIDTNEKKVYITFFGAYLPADDPSFPQVMEFSYL